MEEKIVHFEEEIIKEAPVKEKKGYKAKGKSAKSRKQVKIDSEAEINIIP